MEEHQYVFLFISVGGRGSRLDLGFLRASALSVKENLKHPSEGSYVGGALRMALVFTTHWTLECVELFDT